MKNTGLFKKRFCGVVITVMVLNLSHLQGNSYKIHDSSFFKKKYRSASLIFTSLPAKTKSFDYSFNDEASSQSVTVYPKFKIGIGCGFGFYKRIKQNGSLAIYLAFSNSLNLYAQQFDKDGDEWYFHSTALGGSGKIKEKASTVIYEPSLKMSLQRRDINGYIVNFESGLGLNCNVFMTVNKTYTYKSRRTQYLEFPIEFFLVSPINLELIKCYHSRVYGIALTTQVNDSYSLFNSDQHKSPAKNLVGNNHIIGFNAPACISDFLPYHNYPSKAFTLNLVLSLKL